MGDSVNRSASAARGARPRLATRPLAGGPPLAGRARSRATDWFGSTGGVRGWKPNQLTLAGPRWAGCAGRGRTARLPWRSGHDLGERPRSSARPGADGAEALVAACGARHEGAGERAACLRARLAGERPPAGGRSRQRIWRGVLATCQRRRRWGRGGESDEIAQRGPPSTP